MSVIRMETENVRAAAQKVDWAAGELYYKPSKMRSVASSLTSAWEGGHASAYAAELRRLAGILQTEVINLQRLAQRLRREVDEWEEADRNGIGTNQVLDFFRPGNLPYFSGVTATTPIGLIATLPMIPHQQASLGSGAGGGHGLDFSGEFGIEQSVTEWTKSDGWHDGEPKLGFEAKIGVFDGAYAEGEGTGNWEVGGVDIGGTVGEYGVSQWEAGAKFGVGEDGFTAGAYAEYDLAEVSGAMVLGSSLLGITLKGEASAGSADAFVGLKDNTIGASIGASAAAGDIGLGLNIAGVNIGVEAGLSAGIEFGIEIGAETEVKVGPFKVGLNFGKAISD